MGVLVLTSAELNLHKAELGAKTLNLQKLKEANYNVPNFVAIPANVCTQLFSEHGPVRGPTTQNVVQEILQKLPAEKYAVRSSALIEDTKDQSFAGQFKTELNVVPANLEAAIVTVLQDAYSSLNKDLSQFSLIIQEFIEPDFAGVIFTRNPLGGSEMIIEYAKGRGEEIVSGKIKPEKIKTFPWQLATNTELPPLQQEAERIVKLEQLFQSPQDIEWCMKGNTWYYLQTRPITTISKQEYEKSLYLDQILPHGNYFYKKTEISEIAPTPTPFTFSLLEKIYETNGPIDKVYKKYNVKYSPQNFLVKIGNELFVDTIKELKTLLPPGFKGTFTTIKNLAALNKISLKNEKIAENIQQKLAEKFESQLTFAKELQNFLTNYELIFEVNLLADKAIKALTISVKNESITAVEILSSLPPFKTALPQLQYTPENFVKGNALEIADENPFIITQIELAPNEQVNAWWNSLPQWKQTYFQKIIEPAIRYNKLREFGRWLTVKSISQLREKAFQEAKKMSFENPQEVYFLTVEEIINHQPHHAESRKQAFESLKKFTFPTVLTNDFDSLPPTELQGVSAGQATGKFVNIAEIQNSENLAEFEKQLDGAIIYTQTLTPDLTKYFGKIKGIVSQQGGLLSHLAIMARESHIPVVTGFSPSSSDYKFGENITIDGSTGIISFN